MVLVTVRVMMVWRSMREHEIGSGYVNGRKELYKLHLSGYYYSSSHKRMLIHSSCQSCMCPARKRRHKRDKVVS